MPMGPPGEFAPLDEGDLHDLAEAERSEGEIVTPELAEQRDADGEGEDHGHKAA